MYIVVKNDLIMSCIDASLDFVLANVEDGCSVIEVDRFVDPLLYFYDTNVGKAVLKEVDQRPMLKQQKIRTVNGITVTVGTKVFDGDETSQNRMARAILAGQISGETSTEWKMADNSIELVTLAELEQAFVLASKQMKEIWLRS